MYDKVLIERLAQKYVKTTNEDVFNELLGELEPLIQIQLGKNYSSVKREWDDMKQEVFITLWKNRSNLCFTTAKSLYQFLYNRISRILFRVAEKNKSLNKEKQNYIDKLNENGSVKDDGAYIDLKDVIENIEDLDKFRDD